MFAVLQQVRQRQVALLVVEEVQHVVRDVESCQRLVEGQRSQQNATPLRLQVVARDTEQAQHKQCLLSTRWPTPGRLRSIRDWQTLARLT